MAISFDILLRTALGLMNYETFSTYHDSQKQEKQCLKIVQRLMLTMWDMDMNE